MTEIALTADHPLADTVARLLAPVSDAAPGGADLRYQGTYSQIDEARRNENARLPQGVWQRQVKQADWARVEQLCIDALETRTKDLRITSWLTEAWIYRFGFGGLAPGIALVEGMCRLFWQQLQPSIDGGDPATHIAAVEWLNHRLPIALRQVPVLMDASAPEICFDWGDHLEAERLEVVRARDSASAKRAEGSGSVTQAMIEACRPRTSTEHLEDAADAMRAGVAALAALDTTLDALCSDDAPGLGAIRTLANDIADYADALLAERRGAAAAASEASFSTIDHEPPPRATALVTPPAPTGAMSRSGAYRQLAEIAAFLRENEPHSPVPYLLEQLVEWGKMPLGELEMALRDRGSSISMIIDAIGVSFLEE